MAQSVGDLKSLSADFLDERTGGEISESTASLYALHLEKHLLPRWNNVKDITTRELARYQSERLKMVTLATVKKELSTLRQVLKFCHETGELGEVPQFPKSPRKSNGTRAKGGARGYTEGFSAEHARALIQMLPEKSRESHGEKWPLRGFYELMFETGQRPGMIEGIRYGTHWRGGDSHILITGDIDKNRWERTIPISSKAVSALESVTPKADGRMFRHLGFTHSLRAAALNAGVPRHIAKRVHSYDIRHARITELVNETGKITGVGYLVGHKQMTTTNRYSHAQKEQGAEVVGLMGEKNERT